MRTALVIVLLSWFPYKRVKVCLDYIKVEVAIWEGGLGYDNLLLLTVDQLSLLRRSFLEAENVSLVKCVSLEINCDHSLIFVLIFKIPQSLESRSSSRPVLLFQQMDRTHTFHPHQWTGYIFAAEKENIIQGLFFIFLWGRGGNCPTSPQWGQSCATRTPHSIY